MVKEIILISDHAGYQLKKEIKDFLRKINYNVIDLGPDNPSKISYANQAHKMINYINQNYNNANFLGIAICGTGIGISIALNRAKNVRAARIKTIEDAFFAKRHNNANIIVLGGRQTSSLKSQKIIQKFLTTEFEGGRHIKRIEEIERYGN